jgi:hypothetical protein
MLWGVESNVLERFAAQTREQISFARETISLDYPGTPAQFLAEFRNYYSPMMNAFEAAEWPGGGAAEGTGGAVRVARTKSEEG